MLWVVLWLFCGLVVVGLVVMVFASYVGWFRYVSCLCMFMCVSSFRLPACILPLGFINSVA